MQKFFFYALVAITSLRVNGFAQTMKTVESTTDHVILVCQFDGAYAYSDTVIDGLKYTKITGGYSFRDAGEPWLPEHCTSVGVPALSAPTVSVIAHDTRLHLNQYILPYPDTIQDGSLHFNRTVYARDEFFPGAFVRLLPQHTFRFSRVQPIAISPFRWNPVTRQLEETRSITIRIDFHARQNANAEWVTRDPLTEEYIANSLVNSQAAKGMMARTFSKSDKPPGNTDWYDPLKTYYKMFIKKKGVYRITYQELSNRGIATGQIKSLKIQVFNQGAQIPIDVVDGKDATFDPGDYFQFVGFPPPATPYCRQNIYDSSNVYWLTVEGDTLAAKRYQRYIGVSPRWDSTQQFYRKTDFYEKDAIFERLGRAPDDQRDYWLWGTAAGLNGSRQYIFRQPFKAFTNFKSDSPYVYFRIKMHGMTSYYCDYDHKVKILINGKEVGTAFWNGQLEYVYERKLTLSQDSIRIYPDGNYLEVECDGNICHPDKSDEIRVNWFEFSYLSENRVGGTNLQFTPYYNYPGSIRFWLWQWNADNMKVYVPEQSKVIDSVTILNDADHTVLIVDTLITPSTYFAVAKTDFLTIDSIVAKKPSNLRSPSNGADYIILAHRDFASVAERLKNLRTSHFPDTSFPNPRVKIVYIDEIYDEFSYGLLDPLAMQKFVKYSFDSWQRPAPSYLALLGDMSYDYRRLLPGSRPNFIPAIGYHSLTYGLAASDNTIVCVAGDDIIPDLAIGRLSIEKVEEGNILLDKLESYPADNGKEWKQKVLLLASGLSNNDEFLFGFNDASTTLYDYFLQPNGFTARRVFRYPNKPEHMQYQGAAEEIRKAIDDGAAIINYYGHGGGYQWDLSFMNDDIYVLQNAGRLPLIISVTCYTAHFDNQDVFGEQFNKVPNKGSIGFFGSSGLTHWEVGKYINNFIFDDFFMRKNPVSGKVFLNAKAQTFPIGYYANQIAMLTYLGDPAFAVALPKLPDFAVKETDITVDNANPVFGDSIIVTVHLRNYGIMVSDSITVQLSFSGADTSGMIARLRIPVYSEGDTLSFLWKPLQGGLITLTATVNLENPIRELDPSDNRASIQVPVFNIDEPNVIYPQDGFTQHSPAIKYLFADISGVQNKSFEYTVQIDTTGTFLSPLLNITTLKGDDGLVRYETLPLAKRSYYWRARINEGVNIGKWSKVFSITIADSTFEGYLAAGKQLSFFNASNMIYDTTGRAMLLNKDFLPPNPIQEKIVAEIILPDSATIKKTGMGSVASDGTYLYVGNLSYYIARYHGDTTGKSRIYKIGTGNNGTLAGKNYGPVPNFYHEIRDQFCWFSDGFLYVPIINARKVLKVHPGTGALDSITIAAGLLEKESGTVRNGSFYLAADSQYVYNLAYMDSVGGYKYSLRVFDPNDNWRVVNTYRYSSSGSYPHFCSFFIYGKYFYPYENYYSGFMRRYRIEDGIYESEFIPWVDENPPQTIPFYAWTYDRLSNNVYATMYRPGGSLKTGITKFIGKYLEAKGTIASPVIGPAEKWKTLSLEVLGTTAPKKYLCNIEGYHTGFNRWDLIFTGTETAYELMNIGKAYQKIRCTVQFTDSSINAADIQGIRSFSLGYDAPPDIIIQNKSVSITPDSAYQGTPTFLTAKIKNAGRGRSDSVSVQLKIDGSPVHTVIAPNPLAPDSSSTFLFPINSAILKPNQTHTAQVTAQHPSLELFTYNNMVSKSFFVVRDSVKPKLRITFDGKQIVDGDVVSAKPHIELRLVDDSPLPMDTTNFILYYNNRLLSFAKDSLAFTYTADPEKAAVVTWNPVLKKGNNFLDIKAKDATGNPFTEDSGYYRINFFVYDKNDIQLAYNYPNPFTDGTYFTFELRGIDLPQTVTIKIFTVAGRLIKQIDVPRTSVDFSFNKVYWDGRDVDGNELANGTYFYKIIARYADKARTATQRLVKMR